MAKLLGNNYLVWIESTTPGTYNLIAGQRGVTISRSSSEIDLSSKDDAGYGASAFGLRKLTLDLDVLPSLPDTNGYTRLETLSNAVPAAPFNIQIRKDGAAGTDADAVFEGLVYGNIDSTSFEQDAGVPVKIKFTAAAAPATDALI